MAATRQSEKYGFVPEALWGKFPNAWILMLQKSMRIALEANLLILSFLILYATLVGPPRRSEWFYLLVAALGPVAVAAWYIVFPFNPYRSMAAVREGMKDKDKTDPEAKDLVLLLSSGEARTFLIGRAWKFSLLFFVPMCVISAAFGRMPIWRFGADCIVRIPGFIFVCLFLVFRIELLAWALKNWTNYSGEDRTSR